MASPASPVISEATDEFPLDPCQHIRDLPHQRDHLPHTSGTSSIRADSECPSAHPSRHRAQDAEVEIPIGFAVALSCVLSNRLCLNVRGYIRDGSETLSVPHPEVYSHGRSRSLFATFRIPEDDSGERDLDLDLGSRNDSDGHIEAGNGNGNGKGATVGRSASKVVCADTALGEVEMRELRVMRAESPRHLRMFSTSKRSDEAIEMR